MPKNVMQLNVDGYLKIKVSFLRHMTKIIRNFVRVLWDAASYRRSNSWQLAGYKISVVHGVPSTCCSRHQMRDAGKQG